MTYCIGSSDHDCGPCCPLCTAREASFKYIRNGKTWGWLNEVMYDNLIEVLNKNGMTPEQFLMYSIQAKEMGESA